MKFGCVILVTALSLSVAGCGIFTPPEEILAGVWTVTPADPGDFADWDYEATFDRNGSLAELSADGPDDAMVVLEIDNATSQVDGSTVTLTIPNIAGTRVFEGTLSADQNTMTGSMTEYIDFGDLEARLPGGDLTLERVAS